jgi:alcohol dehydrogenase class IV
MLDAPWTPADLARADLAPAFLWSLPRFEARAAERLRLPTVRGLADVPREARTLVVLGGGTRIDEAKLWRRDERAELRLIAIPSVWGSGAEVSPIVALTRAGKKHVVVDPALVPDARIVWPELADELAEWRARDACGDVWAHAIEAFFSPLAPGGPGELQAELAAILRHLATLPLGKDARWFEAGARACAAQARASVGLVHGIAHVLEGALEGADPERPLGHARLCATFLWPVLALDRSVSGELDRRLAAHGLAPSLVLEPARALFDERAWTVARPALEASWRAILRDPCTRTNGALVRPDHLAFFLEERFR